MATFYQDGIYVGQVSIADQGNVDTSLPTALGQDGTLQYGPRMRAQFDEIRIWRRVPGPEDVALLYGNPPQESWNTVPGGSSGTYGIPILSGSGSIIGGQNTSLQLSNSLENVPTLFLAGTMALNVYAFEAIRIPSPNRSRILTTNSVGDLQVTFSWPQNLPPKCV